MKNTPQILVAESDFQTLYLIEKILGEANFEFDLVCTPTEVVEMLAENNYDLLILAPIGCVNEKIKMGDLAGKITAKRIPILALLENYCDDSQLIGFENCDYLKKPFEKKVFLKKVCELLKS